MFVSHLRPAAASGLDKAKRRAAARTMRSRHPRPCVSPHAHHQHPCKVQGARADPQQVTAAVWRSGSASTSIQCQLASEASELDTTKKRKKKRKKKHPV